MNSESVLVVEDDNATRRLIGQILRPLGIRVHSVVDGAEAIEYLRIAVPDLVILDIALPRLNGWQVLNAIRNGETTLDIPVIVITAHGQGLSAGRALNNGADRFFEKPFVPAELLAAVQELLRPVAS